MTKHLPRQRSAFAGACVWIVDCLAPFGGTDQMIQDFKDKVFPGREVKWRSVGG